MTKLARFVSSTLVIGGQEIPIMAWSTTLSSQGSMGSASAEGSLILLDANGIDVVKLSQQSNGAEFVIKAGFDGKEKLVFAGLLDGISVNEAEDTFELHGRDYAAMLNDGRQTVTGLNYKNQKVAQIVEQIANKFDLTPQVTDPDGLMPGPTMNGENVFLPRPQTWWSLLQKLASDVGYEVYVTSDKVLYFGPEKDEGSIDLSWNTGGENGMLTFEWDYEPRNNTDVEVKVMSHSTEDAQYVQASATATSLGVKGKSKSISGKVSQKTLKGSGGGHSSSKKKSVYYIHATGLSPEQAEKKAEAVAKDLAKRQIIIHAKVEGMPKLKIHSHVNLTGTRFDGLDFNVAEVTHSFGENEGYMTSFRALALIPS